MKIRFLITLSCVLFLSDGVLGDEENEIKRGNYPYMAFIYYPDETLVDATGSRYLRGAVLVRPEWLISSTVEQWMINHDAQGFPRKTLMARVGATTIDANFTLNEDEDEQEREIIQIVRPYNHSATEWWRNDISLLKTLVPFNLTMAVAIASIGSKSSINSGNCYILVFAKRSGNVSDDRVLTQFFVELQPPSRNICGQHFYEETMLCASDSDENKIPLTDDFCLGNSGGPLVCDNKVTGIQTYIENNCKPTHLYQLLSVWDNFITCGIEDKCNEESCSHTCMLINKDYTDNVTIRTREELVSTEAISVVEESTDSSTTVTEEITIPVHYSSSTDMAPEEEDIITTQLSTLSTATEKLASVEPTTSTTATTIITTTTSTPIESTEASTLSSSEELEDSSWPKEKYPERMKSFEEDDIKIERKTSVEAQRQDLKDQKELANGAAGRNMCLFESLFTLVLVSLM